MFDILINNPYSLNYILFEIIFFAVIIYKNNLFSNYKYNAIQKIHDGHIPRLGGLVLFSTFFLYTYNKDNFLSTIILTSLPLFVVALIEDIFSCVKGRYRLLAIFLSSFLFIYFMPLEINKLIIFGFELNNIYLIIIFYILFISTSTNGINLIDGSNGLAIMSIISIFFTILLIIFLKEEYVFFKDLFLLFIFLIVFFLFNYPWGKIFLGDSGAYFLGFLNSTIVIYFYNYLKLEDFISIIILFFYPITEVFFSIIRKIYYKKNPFRPDTNHLHLKLYFMLKKTIKSNKVANGFVMPTLGLVWLSGPIFFILYIFLGKVFFVELFLLFLIYACFYYSIPKN